MNYLTEKAADLDFNKMHKSQFLIAQPLSIMFNHCFNLKANLIFFFFF